MRSNRSNYDNEEDVNNDEEDNDNKSSGVVVISGGGGGGGTTVVSESESENENENENDSENTVPRHDSGNSLLWRIVTKIMSWCYYTHLVTSEDPQHPANLICELCRKFYGLGWVGIIFFIIFHLFDCLLFSDFGILSFFGRGGEWIFACSFSFFTCIIFFEKPKKKGLSILCHEVKLDL